MLPPSILLSQMNEVVAEGDICRFILQSKVSVEQAIYTEIVKYEATVAEQRKYNSERCADPESADAVRSDYSKMSSLNFVDTLTREQGTSSSLFSLLDTVKLKLTDHGRDFALLEHAVNR